MNSNKTIFLAIITLVIKITNRDTKNMPFFIHFDFVEGVNIIDWIANMRLYMSNIEE